MIALAPKLKHSRPLHARPCGNLEKGRDVQKFRHSCRSPQRTACSPVERRCEIASATTKLKRYYHRGQQYSITALTDSSGNVTERYAYTAYGTPTITDGSGAVLTTSADDNRYTYTGREWDETLSLNHFRARMYDSISGRFIGRDPAGYVNGTSLFGSYFRLSLTDPTGLQTSCEEQRLQCLKDCKTKHPGPTRKRIECEWGCSSCMPTNGGEPDPTKDWEKPGYLDWNEPRVVKRNNCYTYAFGEPSHDPNAGSNSVNPGDKCGKPCEDYCDCKTVVNAAKGDADNKFTDINCDSVCPNGTYKIALVVGPHSTEGKKPCDHHWYRQLPNGFWSHKRGNFGIHDQSLGASGNPIRDPRLADRDYSNDNGGANYKDFCGCFCVPNGGIDIR